MTTSMATSAIPTTKLVVATAVLSFSCPGVGVGIAIMVEVETMVGTVVVTGVRSSFTVDPSPDPSVGLSIGIAVVPCSGKDREGLHASHTDKTAQYSYLNWQWLLDRRLHMSPSADIARS